MMEMNQMLKVVVERDASDLHLTVGKPAVTMSGISGRLATTMVKGPGQ